MKISKKIIGLGLATLTGIIATSFTAIKAVEASKIIEEEKQENLKVIEEVHDSGRTDLYSEEDYESDLLITENKALGKNIIVFSIPSVLGLITIWFGVILFKNVRC